MRVRSLESPTSRPCRVIGGKVVCGAQDAEPTGGDHLQESQVQGRKKKTCAGRGRSMVPTRYGRFFAFLKKGVWRSCAAVGLNRERTFSVPAENTCRLREGANRRDGSFARQRSTTSLNAREYLYTPPSRSRVGGAPCTLSTDGNQIDIDNVGNRPKDSGCGVIELRASGTISLTSAKAQYERTLETAGHAPAPVRGR